MKRRMLGAAVLGLGAALAVTGCGAGQITQTASQQAAVNGASAQVKQLAIRDARLAYPEGAEPPAYDRGSDADALMSIVNEGSSNDQLVSVSSAAASNVSLQGDRTIPYGSTLVIGPEEPGLEKLLHAQLVLEGLKSQVRPGQTVAATLTFRDAGRVTVELPIGDTGEPRPSEAHEESGAEGGH